MITIQNNRGFTLFELLVATSVFAIVSYMAYTGLMQVMDARAHIKQVENRLVELQMAFTHLSRDVQQLVNRPVRSEYGDVLPAFKGGELGDYRLELTRTGHRNPARTPRSLLQRIGYLLEDEKLYRVNWPVLDRAQQTEARRSLILEKTESIEIRFLGPEGEWTTSWPPVSNQGSVSGFPSAVAIKIKLHDMGTIDRVFLLPEA